MGHGCLSLQPFLLVATMAIAVSTHSSEAKENDLGPERLKPCLNSPCSVGGKSTCQARFRREGGGGTDGQT